MVEMLTDIGARAVIKEVRGPKADTLSVISDSVLDLSLDIRDLGGDRVGDTGAAEDFVVASEAIADRFRAVGVGSYKELREAETRTPDQQQLFDEVTDAVAMSVYMDYGASDEFRDFLKKGKKSGDYSELRNRFFNIPELDGVEGLVDDYVPANKILRSMMANLSSLANSGGLNIETIRIAIGEILKTDVKRYDEGAKIMLVGYLGEMVAGVGVENQSVQESRNRPIRAGAYARSPFADTRSPFGNVAPDLSEAEDYEGGREVLKDKDSFKCWIRMNVIDKARDPLFFAQWWQDRGLSYLAKDVRRMCKEEGLSLELTAEYELEVYRIGTLCGLEKIYRNADQSPGALKQFYTPPEMVGAMHWSDEYRESLEGDSYVGVAIAEIFNMAFEKRSYYSGMGWKIVEAVSSRKDELSWDMFSTEMADLILSDKKYCLQQGIDPSKPESVRSMQTACRVGLSLFVVDYMHEWIRWAHLNKAADPSVLPWLKWTPGEDGVVAWRTQVEAENEGRKIKMEWGHPMVPRYFDLFVIKDVYTPEIRRAFRDAMAPFLYGFEGAGLLKDEKVEGLLYEWVEREDKKGNELRLKPMSRVDRSEKVLNRINELLNGLSGGSQALEIDSFDPKILSEAMATAANLYKGPRNLEAWFARKEDERLPKVVDALRKVGVKRKNRFGQLVGLGRNPSREDVVLMLNKAETSLDAVEEELGVLTASRLLANIVGVKGEALFSGNYQSERAHILSGLFQLDRFSTQGERDKVLGELRGGDLRGNSGVFRDWDRTFHVDVTGYMGYRNTIVRMMMGEADVVKAWQGIEQAKAIFFYKIAQAAMSGSGGKRR